MPSLTQLLASHGNALILDAASTRVQIGVLRAGAPAIWRSSEQEAGTALFSLVESALREAQLAIAEVAAFIFCEGPGSMLGVRTVAMALRTWQALRPRPCYTYQSLTVAAVAAWRAAAPRAFTLIADARRDSWHRLEISATGELSSLTRVPTLDLPAGELRTPENFRAWTPLPAAVLPCRYALPEIFNAIADAECFRLSESPDAFQHEAPSYKKWSAQIHSSATAPLK